MTAWRLRWGFRELGQYLVICCLSFVIYMLNLFIVILFLCRYNTRFFYLFVIFTCIQIMLVLFHVLIMIEVGKGLYIPSHPLTCILHNISSAPELRPFYEGVE